MATRRNRVRSGSELRSKVAGTLLPEIREWLESLTDKRVILSFSAGKDSLTCWVALEQMGMEVYPFYLYQVPGLQFVEKYLDYLEKIFKCHIMRCLHPMTWNWIWTLAGQPPHRAEAIELLNMPLFNYPDVEAGVRRSLDLPKAWVAVGTRIVDSPQRRRAFLRHGWKREQLKKFYPIYNFVKDDVIQLLKHRGVKLCHSYQMFGRSFDGVDYRYLAAIKEDFPKDYQRILDLMPLQAAEIHRVNFAVKHGIGVVK